MVAVNTIYDYVTARSALTHTEIQEVCISPKSMFWPHLLSV